MRGFGTVCLNLKADAGPSIATQKDRRTPASITRGVTREIYEQNGRLVVGSAGDLLLTASAAYARSNTLGGLTLRTFDGGRSAKNR